MISTIAMVPQSHENNHETLEPYHYMNINKQILNSLRMEKTWNKKPVKLSSKILNNRQRAINGNRQSQNLKISHWNGGAKLWKNKLPELECLLAQQKPDLCFISEANLWLGLQPHEMELPGHQLILPKTMTSMGHARIVLIARNELTISIQNQYMDDKTATIWVKVGEDRSKSILIGGIYREFNQLGATNHDSTWLEGQNLQEERWELIVKNGKKAGRDGKCLVLGDINLNHLKWENPENQVKNMVDHTKTNIETTGFIQLITTPTRFCENQRPSLLDHIWTNQPNRIVNFNNIVRSSSDHNLTEVTLAAKDINLGGTTTRKRLEKFQQGQMSEQIKRH